MLNFVEDLSGLERLAGVTSCRQSEPGSVGGWCLAIAVANISGVLVVIVGSLTVGHLPSVGRVHLVSWGLGALLRLRFGLGMGSNGPNWRLRWAPRGGVGHVVWCVMMFHINRPHGYCYIKIEWRFEG